MDKMVSFEIEPLIIKPLTPDRWDDFEALFGSQGAYGGCWCMWWRLTRREFEQGQGADNRQAMQQIVSSGQIPGLIAYQGDEPCGWVSIAPREQFGSLERSRVLKRVDEEPVWSLVCFYIPRQFRGQNFTEKLIRGAILYVKSKSGKIIEAYPVSSQKANLAPVSSYMGVARVFEKTGFKEMSRPSKSKIIMRYYIDG